VREVEIGVEFGGGPDFARFQVSVIGRRMLDEMRLTPLLEIELQGFEKSPRVAFDCLRLIALWGLNKFTLGATQT
jgi:hypothetical protein